MTGLKLTEQEVKITHYLQTKNGDEVLWEELAQFSKEPQHVKKNTIQRTVSEIKRKYSLSGLPVPFNVSFKSLPVPAPIPPPVEQKLVWIQKAAEPVKETRHPAQIDFELDRNMKRVRTKYGYKLLNDSEWDVFKYIHANPGRVIPISELRDKVVFPQYGSKLPARWFDAIMRIINNLRRQVDGLGNRLLTVKSGETSYLFQ